MRLLGVTAMIMSLASQALAADLALVISNGNYEDLPDIRNVNRGHDRLAGAYRDAGYEVVEGENLDRGEMRQLISRFEQLLGQADNIVIHFSGHGFRSGGIDWLAPVDLDLERGSDAAFGGVPVQPLLQMLATRPGEAALFLGVAEDVPEDVVFTDDLDSLDIPQGVMVVTGEPGAVAEAASDVFLVAGRGADIARNQAEGVSVEGYVSRKMILAPIREAAPEPEPAPEPTRPEVSLVEQALWALAEEDPTEANLGAYINRFPNGAYITEARRLMAELDAERGVSAAEAEEALNLRRSQRRTIQEQLTILGHDTRGVDGIFGNGTRTAVRAWQRSEGLEASGYLDADQIALLTARAEVRREELEAEEAERKRQEELADIDFWQRTGANGTAPDYRAYLSRYPEGLYADQARRELEVLERDEREALAAEEREFWDGIVARNDLAAYREYLERYPNGTYAATARNKVAELSPDTGNNSEAEAQRQERNQNLNTAKIAAIELQLTVLGFNPGAVDGRLTNQTRSALRQFQRREGIPATGYVDNATARKLLF